MSGPEVALKIFGLKPKWAKLVPTRCPLSTNNLGSIGAAIAEIWGRVAKYRISHHDNS